MYVIKHSKTTLHQLKLPLQVEHTSKDQIEILLVAPHCLIIYIYINFYYNVIILLVFFAFLC